MGGSLHPARLRWDNATARARQSLAQLHRSAEAAGYPALLIVSVVCLGLVVVPLALLGLTDAGWVLAVALLNLVAAIAVLASAVDAAMSDYDEPAAGRADPRPADR